MIVLCPGRVRVPRGGKERDGTPPTREGEWEGNEQPRTKQLVPKQTFSSFHQPSSCPSFNLSTRLSGRTNSHLLKSFPIKITIHILSFCDATQVGEAVVRVEERYPRFVERMVFRGRKDVRLEKMRERVRFEVLED